MIAGNTADTMTLWALKTLRTLWSNGNMWTLKTMHWKNYRPWKRCELTKNTTDIRNTWFTAETVDTLSITLKTLEILETLQTLQTLETLQKLETLNALWTLDTLQSYRHCKHKGVDNFRLKGGLIENFSNQPHTWLMSTFIFERITPYQTFKLKRH